MKHLLAPLCFAMLFGHSTRAAIDISNEAWRLWPDRETAWKNDPLYLPAEVNLRSMPVNPPTDGWSVLQEKPGTPVTLPSTVEEHFSGKFGRHPYAKYEAQLGAGTSFQNGNYLGVSWWRRKIDIPDFNAKAGQRVVVTFRQEVFAPLRDLASNLVITRRLLGNALRPARP